MSEVTKIQIDYVKLTPDLQSSMMVKFDQIPCIKYGNQILKLELDDPSPEVADIARDELRETPFNKKQAIIALRDLLKEEKDLKCPLDNDAWLVRFLRPCKFYPESAFELIKRYYAFKVKHSDVYNNLTPSREKNVFQNNLLTVLQNRDQLGRRILVISLGKYWDVKKVKLDEVFKGSVLLTEAALLEPQTQICGTVILFDMDGLSLNQTLQFTPGFAKRMVDLLQDALPLRIKGFHIVNQPYIFNMVFKLFKPFLRDKLKKRIVFHGSDRKSLQEFISAKCLPELYGGTLLDGAKVDGGCWMELILGLKAEYEAINSYGYNKNLES